MNAHKPNTNQFHWIKCYSKKVGLKSQSLFHSLEIKWMLFSKEQWLLNFIDFAFVFRAERVNHFAFLHLDPILGEVEPEWSEKQMAGALFGIKAFGLFVSLSIMPITLKTIK